MRLHTLRDRHRTLNYWIDLFLRDHGFLRVYWHNQHRVAENVLRSNQPGPFRVAKLAKSGIKTIVNLRGPRDDGVWNLEAAACKKAGINLLDFTARSRAAPSKEMLHKAKSLFKSIEKPVLMHCKSGADRAGLMSALYLLVEQGRPVREAMGQLALKYGHLKMAKTGLIDAFFSSYIEYEDSGVPFYEWVDNIYDPEKITATFKTKGWAVRLNDCFLRRE